MGHQRHPYTYLQVRTNAVSKSRLNTHLKPQLPALMLFPLSKPFTLTPSPSPYPFVNKPLPPEPHPNLLHLLKGQNPSLHLKPSSLLHPQLSPSIHHRATSPTPSNPTTLPLSLFP
ncbi:hypothetical protein M501DRAFT_624681 [Patellaria atrata CBS 101060]|uniref:Uncharacterized protein n=1 Tax=Patellaria atrata CBS 101060 TaxID=1346257 RepID=A0A9P4SDD0_9PEZI|nr:hypothetical protein M501DRAFT_624681 [Patellaria atrata CBS 101060]